MHIHDKAILDFLFKLGFVLQARFGRGCSPKEFHFQLGGRKGNVIGLQSDLELNPEKTILIQESIF